MHVGVGQQCSHLEYRNDRHKPDKQIDQRKEKSDRADKHRPVPNSRTVHCPRRRQEVTVQTRHNNDETLEPHTDADDDRDKEQPNFAFPKPLKPQKLYRQAVAKEEQPVGPPIRAFPDAVFDHENFVL